MSDSQLLHGIAQEMGADAGHILRAAGYRTANELIGHLRECYRQDYKGMDPNDAQPFPEYAVDKIRGLVDGKRRGKEILHSFYWGDPGDEDDIDDRLTQALMAVASEYRFRNPDELARHLGCTAAGLKAELLDGYLQAGTPRIAAYVEGVLAPRLNESGRFSQDDLRIMDSEGEGLGVACNKKYLKPKYQATREARP